MRRTAPCRCRAPKDGIEIVHARLLLDHDGDHDLVQRIDIGRLAALAHRADVAPHADAAAGPPRWPVVSARTAFTAALASSTVRMSANSTLWKPEPIARIA